MISANINVDALYQQQDMTCINNKIMLADKKSQQRFLVLNKYQIDYTHMLGQGAMAKVYLGYYRAGESDTSTMFAVKQISINSSMIATDALLQEINLLRKITHPYVLKYIDAKKSPTSLFLFIEYCNRGTLQDLVRQHQRNGLRIGEDMVRRFTAQMVVALRFLKERNIIHRDIKPKNILIHNEVIKISDFGVAKIINKHNSDQETTTFSGTLQYMSPQILKQQKYSYQTDVWSLGITIYFMIFQTLPWKSFRVMGILQQIQQQIHIPEDNIPTGLRDLLGRMLRIEEEDRISIEQAAEHPYLQEQVRKIQQQIANQDVDYQSKQIKKSEFMENSKAINEINLVQLEHRSLQVNSEVYSQRKSQDLAREAYRKLANHKQSILFFRDNLEYLRVCSLKEDKIIPDGLFRKCEFLLVKRCYITAKDLQQILLFSTHAQGNIVVPKNQLVQLMDGKNIYLKTLRSQVDRLYEEFKEEWFTTKEQFYSHQRSKGIRMRARQDAYLDHLVQTPRLVLAFNDCFLDLFFYFAKRVVLKYAQAEIQEIANSTIIMQLGVKIEFIYDLMIILCFPNLLDKRALSNYREQKKKVSCQEYIYRISIAYKHWLPRWEPFEEECLGLNENIPPSI